MRGYNSIPFYDLSVVSGQTMAEIDRAAIEDRGRSGLFLMEQAGQGIAEGMLKKFSPEMLQSVAILCGKGNNGGDGFVVARHLHRSGYQPLIALVGSVQELRADARVNYQQLNESGISVWECPSKDRLSDFFRLASRKQIFVDALLGTGTRGAPRGLIQETILVINALAENAVILSVDIPSGVDADTGAVQGEAVHADWVYTMGLPKIGHLTPPGLNFCPRLVVLDIGFPRDIMEKAPSPAKLLTYREVDAWLPVRTVSTHKGKEGHLLILAGSKGMTGAALMCAKASVQSGAGLVTTVCPESLLPIYAASVWEMMTIPAAETDTGALAEEAFDLVFTQDARWSGVVIGPGLGRHSSTQQLVKRIVREIDLPVLFDGDALAAISPEMLSKRKSPWVATPHPGEMARLFGCTVAEIQADRWNFASRLAGKGSGAVILKGPKTTIAGKGLLWINPTGTPAMASGGMGDTLSGMIGAWLAKGIPPMHAAACGVYLHGLAAELVEIENGAEAVTATQIIPKIQAALRQVRAWAGRKFMDEKNIS